MGNKINHSLYTPSRVLRERKLNRIKNGYAKVSKDGEVYLDMCDYRTLKAFKALISRFENI